MLFKIVLFLIGTLLGASMAFGAFRWLGVSLFCQDAAKTDILPAR
jgi:hypothetical protein